MYYVYLEKCIRFIWRNVLGLFREMYYVYLEKCVMFI